MKFSGYLRSNGMLLTGKDVLGGSKRRYQYCSDNSGRILYLRALQGHSGNNLMDPTLQDNVVIGRHQDAVFWVDIDLGIKEGLTFYQTRSNAIILEGTLPAHYISKVERLKTGEKLYERRYLSPRPPRKISLKHDLNWTKGTDQSGSTVEHQPVGKLVQQSLGETLQAGSSKQTQFPKPRED